MAQSISLSPCVEAIMAQYPTPAVLIPEEIQPGRYCVGGACCLSTGMTTYFPTETTLANALMRLNTRLSPEAALIRATFLICHNQRGAFALAWQEVDKAITSTQQA